MNDLSLSTARPAGISDAEWAARVDLAVAYRAAAHFGWNDTIYNHFTCRVPGEPERFLVKRHGDMFDEVTASSLVKVDMQGRALSFDDDVNPAAFAIHTAILGSRPDVQCTLHLHTPAGIALSARPEGFLFLNQEAAFFHDRISYYSFTGIEERPDEVKALADALAPHHHTLILRNHGVAVAGPSVQSAFIRMQYLLMCGEAQLLATAPSTPPQQLDPALCAYTRDQFEAQERHTAFQPELRALKRLMDRHLPGYAD
ncbi:class II aldolase/adducin family protein [Ramlibacter sp. AW1]|uniref:Class II aldolase/adducin family protein n=1 Tax=Ramlibacter aurantiacus TaxID=2801330 RepID=A0A937D218_9BURK|nr:class II aldolase/adducin family protein [Ramlibacter aurantiacus]MBL0421099.1 class II aldolase/adducin family protein [Ramlibacter aurantiacus]